MLLTFEPSSFREKQLCSFTAFSALWLLIPLVGCPKVQEGRIEKMDTHTHTDTQDNYCNPRRTCVPRG